MNDLPEDLQDVKDGIERAFNRYQDADYTLANTRIHISIAEALLAIAIRLDKMASYAGLLESVKRSELSDEYGRTDES